MKGEEKRKKKAEAKKAAGSVREERKERYTYVVKPRLDRFVRHCRGALFKLYDYLSSLVSHSPQIHLMNRGVILRGRDLTIENNR